MEGYMTRTARTLYYDREEHRGRDESGELWRRGFAFATRSAGPRRKSGMQEAVVGSSRSLYWGTTRSNSQRQYLDGVWCSGA